MKRRNALALMGGVPLFGQFMEKIGTATMNPKDARAIREKFGEHHIYMDGPTDLTKNMTIGSLMLKAGMTPHAPHKHDDEEFMIVTEGTGEIFNDGKTVKVGPGSIMYSASNKRHGIVNTGKTPLLFYYMKWRD